MARYTFGDVGPNSYSFEIEDLQRNLNDYGIPTSIDGVFGPGLSASVARFQLEQALPVSGQADAATVDKLVNIMAERGRISALAARGAPQILNMDPLYVTGRAPSSIPWWVFAGGAFVAWKVLT